ncbi:MAG: SDR family NAD(P)-dependent oxidoreductase [Gammaproteobacteria bacterium]|nr:SDR family NAD(P)-dependent oxidoreductase [Gammaproteobacteria bacterium]
MTEPLRKPPRKNPQVRTVLPTLPPFSRSRKAMAFTAAAAEGRFVLQVCAECASATYPARELCPKCWSMHLEWRDADTGGRLISETTLRTSINTYFRERMPWRIGTVQLRAGPTVLAHIHGDVMRNDEVRMIARTDKSGQGVLMALPAKETPNMADDRQLRELTCDPKHRRVLVTDGRTELGQQTARALASAGASRIFVGIAEQWRPYPGSDDLAAVPGVEIMPLDVTDTISVNELAGEIGGKTDILVNTAEHVRPGGTLDRDGTLTARNEMETNYFGLLRLMQAFAPGMRARGADGDNSACAWVNLLSVYALANWPQFGTTSASHAAAYSLSHCLRGELAGSGVKVINILFGPLEESWRQSLPPPKVTPQKLAATIVDALRQGIESVALGPVAEDVVRRWKEDPAVLERELTQLQAGQAS